MPIWLRSAWGAFLVVPALLVILLLAGCAGSRSIVVPEDGPTLAVVSIAPWPGEERSALLVQSAHYRIYTTISSPDVVRRLARVLEGAYAQYSRLVPPTAASDKPLQCFIFADRAQWARYTEQHAGRDAVVYLQIVRGGYAVGDRFVAYYIGGSGTDSVAAHEGWHQFVGRHFSGRLPPFLEEGIACLFESVQWVGGSPRWDWSVNPNRAAGLRHAILSQNLWPLDKLITMHAGQVVDQPRAKIDAFYAQNWAFARFLWEADGGRYRPAFQRLLSDTAAGTVAGGGVSIGSHVAWDPRSVKGLLERYLGMDLPAIDRAYQRYLHRIAFEESSERPE